MTKAVNADVLPSGFLSYAPLRLLQIGWMAIGQRFLNERVRDVVQKAIDTGT